MSKILELYKAAQSSLGVDKISKEAGKAANTPYSTDDLKKIDEQVLNAAKFKTGRGGDVTSSPKYSDTMKAK
jgi:flagellar biosynthesis/type III secretory pathway M-ring protein FliF/YscJ